MSDIYIILRTQAKQAGLLHYFTGKPCLCGHICERYTSTGLCVMCLRSLRNKHRIKNRESVNRNFRRWVEVNKEKVRTYAKRWRDSHKDRLYELDSKRRAIKKAADGTHSSLDIRALIVAQKDRCAYCRRRLHGKYHVDHIIALTNGGSNRRSNLQITCAFCNIAKGAKDPIDFAQSRGLLI